MSKLTKPNLDYKLLDLSKGNNVKFITNFTWWLLKYVPHYKTRIIADYLLDNGIEFKTKNPSCEIWQYLPPKQSIGLDLTAYEHRLRKIYLENFRKDKPSIVQRDKLTKFDVKVMSQWVLGIPKLTKLKKSSLRVLGLHHPNGPMIHKVKNLSYDFYLSEQKAGAIYKEDTLFKDVDLVVQSEAFEPANTVIDYNLHSDEEINKLRAEVIELRAEVKHIRALLDTKVKDLLRAVK